MEGRERGEDGSEMVKSSPLPSFAPALKAQLV